MVYIHLLIYLGDKAAEILLVSLKLIQVRQVLGELVKYLSL